MKHLVLILLSVTAILGQLPFIQSAQAQTVAHQHDKEHQHKEAMEKNTKPLVKETQACSNIIQTKVNGLVCDFCAQALEKVMGKRKEVSGIEVDLANGKVNIATHPDKTLDDATIRKLVTDSGYNLIEIKRGC